MSLLAIVKKKQGQNQLCFVELGEKRNCPFNCGLLELDDKNKTKCKIVEKKERKL